MSSSHTPPITATPPSTPTHSSPTHSLPTHSLPPSSPTSSSVLQTYSFSSASSVSTPKEWYVRLENIYVNDSYVGYKRIITNSNLVDDIKNTILSYYSLSPSLKPHIRIWSSPFRSKRLDYFELIPLEYDFLSVYLL